MKHKLFSISKIKSIFILLVIAGNPGLFAQSSQQYLWPNHIDTTTNLLGSHVLVRYCESTPNLPYRTYDVICGWGTDPTATTINPADKWRTNFLIRQANDSGRGLRKVAVLPKGFRVNDMEVAWLRDSAGTKRPYCCFCGTWDSTYTYWMIGSSPNLPATEIEESASYGFVGAFPLTAAFGNSPARVAIKIIRETDSLTQMAVRSATGGDWMQSNSEYLDRLAMSAVGQLKSGQSCLASVDLYPSEGGAPTWDYQIEAPNYQDEVLIDVTNSENYTFTLSRIEDAPTNDKRLWVRSIKHSNGAWRVAEISALSIAVQNENPVTRTLRHPMRIQAAGLDSVAVVFQTNDLLVMKLELPAMLTAGTKTGIANATMLSGPIKAIAYSSRNRKTVILQGGSLGDMLLWLPKTAPGDGRVSSLAHQFAWCDITAISPRYPSSAEYLTIAGYTKASPLSRNTWSISRMAYWTMLGTEDCHQSRTEHAKKMSANAVMKTQYLNIVAPSRESQNTTSMSSDQLLQHTPSPVEHETNCEHTINL